MNDKTTPVRVDIGYFKTENNILTLEIYLVEDGIAYDLTGKTITAIFQEKPPTSPLSVSDGLIQLPITSDLLVIGKNKFQLSLVYGDYSQELTPIFLWQIETPVVAGIDGESLDILTSLITQCNAINDAEALRVTSDITRGETFDALVAEYNLLKADLLQQIADGTESVDALEVLEADYAQKALTLETTYAPELNLVKSQLAETMNKTAITLNHIFADSTARDNYFTANPLEKINLTFIKVGAGYQQLINNVWTSANPILVEAVNQIDDASTGLNKTLSASKELALLALKADKTQENWLTMTLINGWTGILEYMKDSLGFVHLRGNVKTGVPISTIGILPIGYRPQILEGFIGYGQGSTILQCRYAVITNGEISMQSIASNTNNINAIFKAV